MIDLLGNLLSELKEESSIFTINLKNLLDGFYVVQVLRSDLVESHFFVKQ